MASNDFDFGFSLVDENELEAVQQAYTQASAASGTAEQLQAKIDTLYNMIMPLLNNLQKNPEKEYIYWPNRTTKIEEFRDRIQSVYND
jgi:uncharacterized protein Yka (UPF0111/DUF47 family)